METHQAEKLMKKIEELEAGQARLKQEVTRLKHCGGSGGLEERRVQRRSHSLSPRRRRPEGLASRTFGHSFSSPLRRSVDTCDPMGAGGGLSDWQYRRVLQSMGQSVHIFDLEGKIIYWNRSAEQLYGYAASEAIGQDAVKLIVDACNIDAADSIINQIRSGECWAGRFPVKNKLGEHFLAIATNSPFYNDDGGLAGIICVSSDSRNFIEVTSSTGTGHTSLPRINPIIDIGADIQQPIPKITALVGEFRGDQCSGLRSADAKKNDHREDLQASDASTSGGDAQPNHFGCTWASNEEQSPGKAEEVNANIAEENLGIKKILNSKVEAHVSKKGLVCHRKGNEHNGLYFKHEIAWPYSQNENECDGYHPKSNGLVQAVDNDGFRVVNRDGYGSLSSFNTNNINSASSSGSTSNRAIERDIEAHCLDYEILWEDLTIGEPIGQGSCGAVHHALWYGSDVAVKVFSRQEYSDEAILSFRQEVSVMKRLRHPNILLFMGAVTSPRHLCIITEFLPRGSLFRLLQRSTTKLDWRRRLHIALDIARGMNYLHHCNPPIIHRDLKSSNLLVDKNWTVKVGDFGLSRLKHETDCTTMCGKGTPQWMAPEVLRNEPSDEKSDVFSFGVILWELVTEKIPWENLNSMQVIGAVGFMDQRLDLPADLDSRWHSIIERCWRSDPQSRPSFQELLESLRELQRQYVQSNVQRTSRVESLQTSAGTVVQE